MTTSGDQIGAYRMVKRLGAGGMGEVWLAEHTLLGRRAAIKLLHPSFSAQPDIVTRFFNEARAATSIADPGIVQIFDFGNHESSAYIVMELLDGETLDARWRRLRTLSIADALRILRQVSSSLGAAHARGIVHRDLKPENIFLVPDPEVPGGERAKILDFGIAKLTSDAHIKTQTAAVMGTPTFMAPEQCRGAGLVDQRADVYSLGCVLFTLVVGHPPFEAEGLGELLAMHLREPAPRASTKATGIPGAVDDLIARCLEKDPAARYASGRELAAALGALLTVPPGASLRLGMATTMSGTASEIIPPPAKRSRVGVIAAVAGGCVVAGAIAIAATMHSGSPSAPAAPPAPVIVDAAPAPVVAIDAAVTVDAAPPPDAAVPVDAAPPPDAPPAIVRHSTTPPRPRVEPTPTPTSTPTTPSPTPPPAPPTSPPKPAEDFDAQLRRARDAAKHDTKVEAVP